MIAWNIKERLAAQKESLDNRDRENAGIEQAGEHEHTDGGQSDSSSDASEPLFSPEEIDGDTGDCSIGNESGSDNFDNEDDSDDTTSVADDDDDEGNEDRDDVKEKEEGGEEEEKEGSDKEWAERVLEPYLSVPILGLVLSGYVIWVWILMEVILFLRERIHDGIELYVWVRFLWREDAFLFGRVEDVPHFIPPRALTAARKRIVAAYIEWEDDVDNDEPLILEGEDMKIIARQGWTVEDVLIRERVIQDAGELDEEDSVNQDMEAAWEKAEREIDRLGPEAVVLAWYAPRELRRQDDVSRWVSVTNDWEEDVEEVFKQRRREREGDLRREFHDWLGAVAILGVVVILGNLLTAVNWRGLVGMTHTPLPAS
ncbi:hypothetical protein QBC36DRAFT_311567 [Triangularia setosa]|uniref:Uncharacterized protein n=1 Tax=Triangularia setosa TaxID=2587417 RepID=A0AAN6W5V1_9PEZI|nr:hypothetical protein QBC36DRAFT_311567 [Podospora setosa]